MHELLNDFKTALEAELQQILSYWMQYGKDEIHGGFAGRIDHANRVDVHAGKGSVLNSRILWTFSAAYRATKNPAYLQHAQRAFQYFSDHFIDKKYGGVYWSVDAGGHPANPKKQIYAQSFGVYALSEFYLATGDAGARQSAIRLYDLIERYSYDAQETGYLDAFTETWTSMEDIRLSEKDANEKKTMNTHLHILEGYSNLYRVWPNAILKSKIQLLLLNFFDHIIDDKTNHLVLFFDEQWNPRSGIVSYGHDIEAAWLLQEAAETIGDGTLIEEAKDIAVKMADAVKEGIKDQATPTELEADALGEEVIGVEVHFLEVEIFGEEEGKERGIQEDAGGRVVAVEEYVVRGEGEDVELEHQGADEVEVHLGVHEAAAELRVLETAEVEVGEGAPDGRGG